MNGYQLGGKPFGEKLTGNPLLRDPGDFIIFEEMKQEEFLKKVGIYSRYLSQFLNEENTPRILETIRELEGIRQQAEKEKVE